jgi:cation:H+ antiporter
MLINTLTLIAGLIALFFSANKFVTGSASIARNFNLSPLLIGLTIVGFGTSVPEMLIAGFASFSGNSEIGIGNALGSNIANIGLVLALTALVKPVVFDSGILKQELPILMAISLLCYFVAFDGLGRGDSLLMLLVLLIFLVWLVRSARKEEFEGTFEKELKIALPDTVTTKKAWIYFAAGLAGLLLSSKLSVWAAANVAHLAGVSELIIGLTIVALGTSLPELATSISSILKKEDDLAVGNIIGSNIYNLLAVYSLPGLIVPGASPEGMLTRDFPVMLGFSIVLFFLGRGFGNRPGVINRWEAGILLVSYASYLWFIYQNVTAIATTAIEATTTL